MCLLCISFCSSEHFNVIALCILNMILLLLLLRDDLSGLCALVMCIVCDTDILCVISGFYDTANETFDPMNPNFKRLRQQQLEGERRGDKEAVR